MSLRWLGLGNVLVGPRGYDGETSGRFKIFPVEIGPLVCNDNLTCWEERAIAGMKRT
jgi:hypothetical protein